MDQSKTANKYAWEIFSQDIKQSIREILPNETDETKLKELADIYTMIASEQIKEKMKDETI